MDSSVRFCMNGLGAIGVLNTIPKGLCSTSGETGGLSKGVRRESLEVPDLRDNDPDEGMGWEW